jgi:hypothetical protein
MTHHCCGREVIRAELTGTNYAEARGVTVRSPSPVLDLARKLIAAGHDPATPLAAWRGPTLCLRVRSIGDAARLRVKASLRGSPIFAPMQGMAEGPPARQNVPGAPIAAQPFQEAA